MVMGLVASQVEGADLLESHQPDMPVVLAVTRAVPDALVAEEPAVQHQL